MRRSPVTWLPLSSALLLAAVALAPSALALDEKIPQVAGGDGFEVVRPAPGVVEPVQEDVDRVCVVAQRVFGNTPFTREKIRKGLRPPGEVG